MEQEQLHETTNDNRSLKFQVIALGILMATAICVYLLAIVSSATR